MTRPKIFALLACLFVLSPAVAETKRTISTKKAPTTTSPSTTSGTSSSKSRVVAAPFPATEESGPPDVRGEAYIVVDAQSGRVIHEKNADQQRPVASTQKLLTGLIVAEEG